MAREILGVSTRLPGIESPRKRTLKAGEINKLKKEKGMRCQRCKRRFPIYVLELHHKKPIHAFRDGTKLTIPLLEKIRRPSYDWKKNLMVLCRNCHKIKHHELSQKEKEKN